MTQDESKLSSRIMAGMRQRGVWCMKIVASESQMAGVPDILACVEGWFVGFETKMPDKRKNVSPRQAYVHEQIENAGGKVYVVCSVSEALQIVDEIMSACRSLSD